MRRLLVIPILLIEALLALVAGKAAAAKGGCGLYGTTVNGDIKHEGVLGLLLTTIVAGSVKSTGTIVLLE